MSEIAIEARDLTKKFRSLVAVDRVNFSINYGDIFEKFSAKYGIKLNELNPDGSSGEEIEAIKANKNNTGRQAPDVLDVGLSFGPQVKADGLVAPYKVATWNSIPANVKDADGYWYGDYYGALAFEVNTDIVKNPPKDWKDLLKPEYKGQIALAGDPRTSNQAFLTVAAAGVANGGSFKDIMPGLQTGLIDAYPTTPLLGRTLQWDRMTPNMVGMGLAPLVGGLVMTKQAWARIAEPDRARILESCARLEHKLEVEVPRQDTVAVAEMKKRGLKVNLVTGADATQFRATAEQFANSMKGVRVPPDILEMARRERDAFRQKNGGGAR